MKAPISNIVSIALLLFVIYPSPLQHSNLAHCRGTSWMPMAQPSPGLG